jgi:hypothetical protein
LAFLAHHAIPRTRRKGTLSVEAMIAPLCHITDYDGPHLQDLRRS